MQSTNIYYMFTRFGDKHIYCPTTNSIYIEDEYLGGYVWVPTLINIITVGAIGKNIEIIEADSRDEAESVFHLLYE